MDENAAKEQQQAANEDAKAEEVGAEGAEGSADAGQPGPRDRNGEPGINRDKYQRDIRKRDERIAELEARIAEAAKTEETAKELREEMASLKAEMADKDVSHALEMAGCRNVKAAKALMDDFEGVEALKEANPWLFEDRQKGSTGLAPKGPTKGEDEETRRIREALGTSKYYEK